VIEPKDPAKRLQKEWQAVFINYMSLLARVFRRSASTATIIKRKCVFLNERLLTAGISSSVTGWGVRGRVAGPGKLNVKTGPPLFDILIFSIL